jgi:hypothetical protein
MSRRHPISILVQILWTILFSTIGSACGLFPSSITIGGGTGSANDPVPTGTLISQGTFTSLGGPSQTSGAVQIYYSSGAYTLRLAGLSAPSESGLTVTVSGTPGGELTSFPLQNNSGSTNYTLSIPASGVTFNTVYIYSTQSNQNYASAQMFKAN